MKNDSPLLEAAKILVTESNELARLLDAKAFAQMNYRVEIAVRTEVTRLRTIADGLQALAPHAADEG